MSNSTYAEMTQNGNDPKFDMRGMKVQTLSEADLQSIILFVFQTKVDHVLPQLGNVLESIRHTVIQEEQTADH